MPNDVMKKINFPGLGQVDLQDARVDDLAPIKSVGSGLSLDSETGELSATGGGGGGGASEAHDLAYTPENTSWQVDNVGDALDDIDETLAVFPSLIPDPSDSSPAMDGTAAAGSSTDYARADHVHPKDSSIPTQLSDLTNDAGFITGLSILSYGSSTWNDFITAYNANKIVFCRASSNSNPASGSQTRIAFLANVDDVTNPTEVEFQYYRSIGSHTAAQQGDQIFIYKLTSAGTWTVTTRESATKILASTNMSSSYSNGTLTLYASQPAAATATPEMDGTAAVGSSNKWAKEDHVHPTDTTRQAALVSGTNIKTINNESLLGSGNISISAGGASVSVASVEIAAADWSSKTCTKNVTGVTASNHVIVTYAPASKDDYANADIYCSAQGSGTLTFSCSETPTAAVTVNVMIIDS